MGAIPSPQRIQHARAALLHVKAALLAEDPAIADDARLMIDCLDSEAGDALDIIRAMVRACRAAEAQAAGAKAEADAYAEPLRERSARLAHRARRIRAALLSVCEALDQRKWEDACFTLSVTKAPPTLFVTDEALIPGEYFRTRRELDSPAALAALKDGKDLPGACLSNGAPRLTIRDRCDPMPTDPQATNPVSYWRTLHDKLLADPALRRAAKEIDPGAFSLAGTSKRRDDAVWQAHVRSAHHG